MEDRLQNWKTSKLTSYGLTLFRLVGRLNGCLFNETIIRFTTSDYSNLPFHRFTRGDMILISRRNPLEEKATEGNVLDKGPSFLTVVVRQPPNQLTDGVWVNNYYYCNFIFYL